MFIKLESKVGDIKLKQDKLDTELVLKLQNHNKDLSQKLELLKQQMNFYLDNQQVTKNVKEPQTAKVGEAPGVTLNDILASPFIDEIKRRQLRSEQEIITLRQVAKNVEILQQEIVQIRQENLVSYKMMQNLQLQQTEFDGQIRQKKLVEIDEENQAYKQLMQKF